MSIIGSKEEITKYFTKHKPNIIDYQFRKLNAKGTDYDSFTPLEAYEKIREYAKNCVFVGKGRLRPWHIVPMAEVLDPTKVWVGFEMETGYATEAQRKAAQVWFDKEIDRGIYDVEGTRPYPIEFTFYPTHVEDIEFNSGVTKLIEYGYQKGCEPVPHDSLQRIGTHANISTPNSRAGKRINEEALRNVMLGLTPGQHETLFGRSRPAMPNMLYGRQGYYEFKIFNSTYDLTRWSQYCIVVRKLVAIIDLMEKEPRTTQATIKQMFLDAIDECQAAVKPKKKAA